MVKDAAGHWQVWVANPDLSGAKKLTRGRYDTGWAVWSPGGKWLVFDSSRTDHTPNNSRHVNDVFVMKPDGSGVKKLTDSKGVSGDAAWSPNGSLIAFEAESRKPQGTQCHLRHARERPEAEEGYQSPASVERLQAALLAGRNASRVLACAGDR
jgi:Tol biopolymer transport system component